MRLKTSNILVFIAAVTFVFCKVAFAADFPFMGTVTADNINVRSDSTVSATVLCTLNKNDKVEVLLDLYDWYKIRLPKSAPSYVKKELTECIKFQEQKPTTDPTARQDKPKCVSAKIIKDHVNVRIAASESSSIVGKLDKDMLVNVLDESGAWYKIEPVHDSYAWISKKFVVKLKDEVLFDANPKSKSLSNSSPVVLADRLMVIQGVIKPYGVVLWRKATHKLISADNKIYLLKGNKKSLDALLGRKVRVSGRQCQDISGKYPVIEVSIIEATN